MRTSEQIQKLLDNGFKPYRLILKNDWNADAKKQAEILIIKEGVIFKEGNLNSKESVFFSPITFNNTYHQSNFNAMLNGGLDVRFIKDENISTQIIFGLDVKDEPAKFLN